MIFRLLQHKYIHILSLLIFLSNVTFGQSELHDFLNLEDLKIADSTVNKLIQLTVENSYDLKALEAERQQYRQKIKIEKSNWLGAFRVGVNFFNVQTTLDENQNSITTAGLLNNVGLNVTFSPGDFMNINKQVKIAKNGMKRIESFYLRDERDLKLKTSITYNRYLEVMELIHSQAQAYQIALENHVIVSSRFKKGRENFEALKKSQDGLLDIKQELIKSKYQALRYKSELLTYAQE